MYYRATSVPDLLLLKLLSYPENVFRGQLKQIRAFDIRIDDLVITPSELIFLPCFQGQKWQNTCKRSDHRDRFFTF